MSLLNRRIDVIIVLVTLASLISCKPSPRSAQQYYGKVTDLLEPLLHKEDKLITLINKEMKKAVQASSVLEKKTDTISPVSFQELDNAYIDFKVQADESLNSAKKLEVFNGEVNLVNALTALLEEYKQVVSTEYPGILYIVKKSAAAYTNEDDNQFITLTEKVDNRLQEKIDVFTRESKTFALKYKFEIATNKDSISNQL